MRIQVKAWGFILGLCLLQSTRGHEDPEDPDHSHDEDKGKIKILRVSLTFHAESPAFFKGVALLSLTLS